MADMLYGKFWERGGSMSRQGEGVEEDELLASGR